MTGKSGRGTARQTLRIPEDEWEEFGAACDEAGVDRSVYVLDAIRWALGRPGVKAPKRLPGALLPGIQAHIDGVTPRTPKGHTVYSLVAEGTTDEVHAAVRRNNIDPAVRYVSDRGRTTRVEAPGDLAAIEVVRSALLAQDVGIVGVED